MVCALALEVSPEALHGRIVQTVAGVAHADDETVITKFLWVSDAGVLAAAVRMVHDAAARAVLDQGHLQRTVAAPSADHPLACPAPHHLESPDNELH